MVRKRGIALIVLCALITGTAGCARKNQDNVNNKNNIEAKALTAPVEKINSANNKMAFKFLRSSIMANKNKNVVTSPLSLDTILSLTQNGAAGKTREEMLEALEMKGYDGSSINEDYKDIIANFNSLKAVQVKMGNSIWIDQGLAVKEAFKDVGKKYYEADINEVDFSKTKTVDTVNRWVSDRTAGRIKKITDKFDDGTAMVLINTVYFKGAWKEAFEKSSTYKHKFKNGDGSESQVDMMKSDLMVDYLKGDGFQAVRLPYKDENIGMYVFLPDEGKTIDEFAEKMTLDNWNRWNSQFSKMNISVEIPRFKVEFEQKLNDVLKGFGMKSAFEDSADFSNIRAQKDLCIDLVKQKCYIDVNETGTEAAAATEVEMKVTCMPVGGNIKFSADRPFVYAIADNKTGLIMFAGVVDKP